MGSGPQPIRPKREAQIRPGDRISITIGADGRPLCDPFLAHIDPADVPAMNLQWSFAGGAWTVRFLDGRTPLDGGLMEMTGKGANADKPSQVDRNLKQGRFRYAVAVAKTDPATNAIVVALDAACPEIIIGV